MKSAHALLTLRNLALVILILFFRNISAQIYKSTIGLPLLPGQFRGIRTLATDADGNVYVVDGFSNNIQKFDKTGGYVTQWGSVGSGNSQFRFPEGIATDVSGNVYVVDGGNHRIQKFSSTGGYITQWGRSGFGNSQFNNPYGITTDASGNVYVADDGNSRIQKFSSTGVYITQWGSYGSGNSQFNSPTGIATDAVGNIYVADYGNHRIQKFSSTGVYITQWGSFGSGNSQFNYPLGITTDATGDIYVADQGNDRIQKFSNTGGYITQWGSSSNGNSQFSSPSDIATDASGNVYVVDNGNNRIQKFDNTGDYLTQWGSSGVGNSQFKNPYSIATDASGNVYVSDLSNNRIQKFSSTGDYLTQWGSSGVGNSQFNLPYAIATDASENVYVADIGNHRIQKFDNTGSYLTQWGSYGSGNSQFNSPSGIATDTAGNIYVSDRGNDRIQKFSSTGSYITQWGSFGSGNSQFNYPLGITTDATGDIYVADQGNDRIQKFSNTGGYITQWGSYGSGNSQFYSPFGIATDATGNIYVADNGNHRIQVFIITKLNITAVDYPKYFTLGEAGLQGSISVNDINEVQDVKFISRGITEEETVVQIQNVNFTTASNTITFTIAGSYFKDPLALYSWFVLTDKLGNEIKSTPKYTYLKYPTSSNAQVIPGLTPGRKVSNYQMISIPLKLANQKTENVFKDLGEQADNKWRLFSYNTSTLQTEPNPSSISEGQGYWLIVRDQNVINPGEGTTVEVTNEEPFILNLKAGENFIGNPYNFTISWDDVLEYNSNPTGVKNLRQYIAGAAVSQDLLAPYRGAFVKSDTDIDIEIPIINRNTGGRKKQDEKFPIDANKWTVNFSLDDGEFRNELFGFGMNPRATEAMDEWDETNLPILEGMSSFEMTMRTVDDEILAKDFVPTQDQYTWETQLHNSKNIILKWDNSYFGVNEKQLVIDDSELVEVMNMRSTNQMVLAPGSHQIKIHYGDQQYIKDHILRESVAFGYISPNPIKQRDQQIRIAANLPEGKYEVSFKLFDTMGRDIIKSGEVFHEGGRYALEWNSDFSNVRAGLYLLRIEVKGTGGTTVEFRKVVVE